MIGRYGVLIIDGGASLHILQMVGSRLYLATLAFGSKSPMVAPGSCRPIVPAAPGGECPAKKYACPEQVGQVYFLELWMARAAPAGHSLNLRLRVTIACCNTPPRPGREDQYAWSAL